MPDCNSNHCSHNHHHSAQLENSPSAGGLVPSSKEQPGLVSSLSSSSRSIVDSSCSCSSSVVVGSSGGLGVADPDSGRASSGRRLFLVPEYCWKHFCKMFTCRVLIVLLVVKCIILSLIIPAHLHPTSSSEYPPPDYSENEVSGSNGGSHAVSTGDEDGFDNNNMMDDQPFSLKNLTKDIKTLVGNFYTLSQPVTPADSNAIEDTPATDNAPDVTDAPGADDNDGNDGNGDDDDKDDAAPTSAPAESADKDADSQSDSNGESANETAATGGETESQVENVEEAAATSETEADSASDSDGTAASETSSSNGDGGNGHTCSGSDNSDALKTVLEKIESLSVAVKNIDTSIDKMETLVQSTMIDERVYKCVSAISHGNQTQALKYWKQILKYLSTTQKQAAILNQIIRDSYGGSEEHILPVIQFIDQTTHYYGYHTLFKELPKHDHLYRNTAVFTLGHYAKKSCGRDSTLYKSLPGAVQTVMSDFFTLQNKHNKGYLYYAKRCVAKHYHHCLDVLTKRIDPYVLDGLAEDSEEKKRFHWKLNATDATVTKFFILNHDKYWTYRLQDLNNSPRFKMEEAGSNAEVELAQFLLKLHTDDELMIQVRDSEDYLEEEDFKSDKSEVRLHSFHKADGIPDSPRMFWLVNPVPASGDDGVEEPASCNIELASVSSNNGNGNGNSK